MSLQTFSLRFSPWLLERLSDLLCVASVIGIWPRFIEPKLICTSYHDIPVENLPTGFEKVKIVQISDLHFSSYTSQPFLDRILAKIKEVSPDIIVFTGDLLCYSEMPEQSNISNFLSSLSAPLGCFAIFGNHDYSEYVSYGDDGTCRRIQEHISPLLKGLARIFWPKALSGDPKVTSPIAPLDALTTLFQKSGFTVLNNETVQLGAGNQKINITGLGDYIAGQLDPHRAFAHTDVRYPGIVLSHNPDSYPLLKAYPGNLYLFGHTHGGQINIPFIWQRVTPLKHREFKSGLVEDGSRVLYINRGLGSSFPFRCFAPPEVAVFTLYRGGAVKRSIVDSLFIEEPETPEAVCRTSQAMDFKE